MSDASPTNAPPAAPQYSVDWNNVALQAITTGLNQIPVVGGILAGLVFAFWPPSGQDIWAEIKQNVETLVQNDINNDDYAKAQEKLGTRAEDSGLLAVLNTYLQTLTPDFHPRQGVTSGSIWADANITFIDAQPRFQQKDIRVLLLPLFAQFANMHLTLLRDGALKDFPGAGELGQRIGIYTKWVDDCYAHGLEQWNDANKGFNYVNQYIQFMQVNVMRFREMWPYFDPAKYPPPVKPYFSNQTYFTVTGELHMTGGTYQLPASVPDSPLTDINVYWLQDLCDEYNLLLGTQVNYGGTQEPYTGSLVNNATPPTDQPCDPNNDYFCYHQQGVGVSAGNPVVAVNGVYDTGGGAYCVDFVYQDGSSTGQIPSQNQQDYPTSFNIAPPKGYYLSSVWVPSGNGFYNAASDVVFGFRYTPPPLDEAAAHALYVSSLQPIPADDPLFAPFAEVAASQGWEEQRQNFVATFQGTGTS